MFYKLIIILVISSSSIYADTISDARKIDSLVSAMRVLEKQRFYNKGELMQSVAKDFNELMGALTFADEDIAPAELRVLDSLKGEFELRIHSLKLFDSLLIAILQGTNPYQFFSQRAIKLIRIQKFATIRIEEPSLSFTWPNTELGRSLKRKYHRGPLLYLYKGDSAHALYQWLIMQFLASRPRDWLHVSANALGYTHAPQLFRFYKENSYLVESWLKLAACLGFRFSAASPGYFEAQSGLQLKRLRETIFKPLGLYSARPNEAQIDVTYYQLAVDSLHVLDIKNVSIPAQLSVNANEITRHAEFLQQAIEKVYRDYQPSLRIFRDSPSSCEIFTIQ